MGSHPLNLAVRFFLEISALIAIAAWGWKQSDDWFRFVLVFSLPILIAAIWGVFAVPNDPSRSGSAPIAVPGIVRLLIEFAIFGLATWSLFNMGFIKVGWIFGIIVFVHYVLSYDRIMWLMSK